MRAERSFSSGSESKAKVANDVAKYARASLPFIPDDADPIPESYPFTVLHHHKHPELLPPRDPGSMSNFAHHVSSSIDAVASLCTAQENRDRFLELTDAPSDEDNDGNLENRCIIDTSILRQSELGFMKVLTLYQDLNNPLFRQYPKFDIQGKDIISCYYSVYPLWPIMSDMASLFAQPTNLPNINSRFLEWMWLGIGKIP